MKCFRCESDPCNCPDGQTVYVGDCREVLRLLPDESVHAVVTDPPYHLTTGKKGGTGPASLNEKSPAGRARISTGFMGKAWDGGDIAHDQAVWAEVLRVAKPGAHLLAFGGTRTFHRLAVAIEDAGWEIRDCIMWVYGSGFPKSLDVSKAIDKEAGATRPVVGSKRTNVGMQGGNFSAKSATGDVDVTAAATAAAAAWDGWGTALKPAWEPIIVARKPLKVSVAKNVQQHGTGALNIDGCRVEGGPRPAIEIEPKAEANGSVYAGRREAGKGFDGGSKAVGETTLGRWPANVIHDGSPEATSPFPFVESGEPAGIKSGGKLNCYSEFAGGIPATGNGDAGSAARFFYCAKALGSDRGAWNTHPTVKPQELMAYLVKLVAPIGATVLDPFAGSGTTLQVARKNGCRGIGIELNPEYAKLIAKRLEQRTLFTESA